MISDERTQLLAKPATHSQEEGYGKPTRTPPVSNRFALWQLGALCGILLAYADTSLVWATHETVASHFSHLKNASWMMTSFTIGYCVTLPLYGRLSDNYGRLHPLIAAYGTFCVGCTLCGIGQTYWQVILGRVITGCGASGIISLASIIITDIATPSNVAVLRSYVNVAATAGFSLGGPLGGFLAGLIGWRWSFLGQVPIAIACCVLMASGLQTYLPVRKEEVERRLRESEHDLKSDVLAFDFSGAISLAIWVSCFLAVMDLQSQLSWTHPLLLSAVIMGTVSFLAFIALETFPGSRELLIPMSFLMTEVGAFCVGQLLMMGSSHGFISQIAPYFANTRGFSDAEAGGQIVPASIGNALGSLIAGHVIRKFGRYKRLSLASLPLFISISLWILVQWSHPIGNWGIPTTFLFGLFGSIILSAQFIGLYHCAPKSHMATSISMYYMSQQIGIAMGISISSSLLRQRFESTLGKVLINVPDYQEIIKKVLVDSSVVALLPEGIKALVWQSYLKSFWVVPAFFTSVQVLAVLPILVTTERFPD